MNDKQDAARTREADRVGDEAIDAGIKALEATSVKLASAVQDLSAKLTTTQRIQEDLDAQQKELRGQRLTVQTQKKMLKWLAVSVVLDLVLSVAVTLGYFRIDHNTDNINEIQTRTSSEVLCPLYQLLVDQAAAITDKEKADMTAKEREDLEKTVAVITRGYNALDCGGV